MTPPDESERELERLHELSGSYAVDALTGDELRDFEVHLLDCDRCRDDVRSYGETLVLLDDLVDVAPPPALRAGVLAAIAGTQQLPPVRTEDGRPRHAAGPVTDLGAAEPSAPADDPSEARGPRTAVGTTAVSAAASTTAPATAPVSDLAVARERRERRSGRGRAWIAVAAAAAVIAVGAGGWAVNLNRQLDQQRQAQVAGQQLNQRESTLLNAPDAKVYSTTLNDGTPVSYVVSKRLNQAMLVAADVRSPGSDRVWQLWTVPGSGQPVRDTTFGAGSSQRVFMTGDINQAGALAITVERAGSTPAAPTMAPFAVVKL